MLPGKSSPEGYGPVDCGEWDVGAMQQTQLGHP